MKKNIEKCSTCSRNKIAQEFNFVGNDPNKAKFRFLGRGGDGDSAPATTAPATTAPTSGSSASDVAVGAAAGSSAKGLGSRLWSGAKYIGRGLGWAGAAILPGLGTYLGAHAIEEAIDSANEKSVKIRPSIANNLSNLLVAKIQVEQMMILVKNMTGLSTHVDNYAAKLYGILLKTHKEIVKEEQKFLNKKVNKVKT